MCSKRVPTFENSLAIVMPEFTQGLLGETRQICVSISTRSTKPVERESVDRGVEFDCGDVFKSSAGGIPEFAFIGVRRQAKVGMFAKVEAFPSWS